MLASQQAALQIRISALLALLIWLVQPVFGAQAQVVATLGEEQIEGKELLPESQHVSEQRRKLSKEQFNSWLRLEAGRQLQGIVLGSLLEKFAETEGIEPTEEEVAQFIHGSDVIERKEAEQITRVYEDLKRAIKEGKYKGEALTRRKKQLSSLSRIIETSKEAQRFADEYPEEQLRIEQTIGRQFVRRWKINKALYDRFGGRVIFQQAGPEPIDAYRVFLEGHEEKGSFSIKDKRIKESFWQYFTDSKLHLFLPETDGKKAIHSPWWVQSSESESQPEVDPKL